MVSKTDFEPQLDVYALHFQQTHVLSVVQAVGDGKIREGTAGVRTTTLRLRNINREGRYTFVFGELYFIPKRVSSFYSCFKQGCQ